MGGSSVALIEKRKQGEASGGRDGGSAEVDKKGRTTTLTEQYKTPNFLCPSINARVERDIEHSRPCRDSKPPLGD